MENVPLFKSPTNVVKSIAPQPNPPVAQTFDRRNRAESDSQNPDRKILIMNYDPNSQKHQQSNPTTPRTGVLP